MPDPTAADLEDLLARPREALDIEVKRWLDLGDNNQRADLAKAILAIANHGGGFVVIGLAEADAGQFAPDPDRPADLSHLTQDDIQDAVQKYLEPPIQCRAHHVEHPEGHGWFPVVVVPGGHRVPIKAKAGSPDGKVVANRVYIRRPGPRSEEPQTAAEWDQLFERCIRARRDELLDGIRDLLAGVVPKVEPVTETASDRLADFMTHAIKRWTTRVHDLPVDSAPRFPHGFYEVAVALEGDFPLQSAGDFLDVMKEAVRNHTGWPPFPITGRDINRPKPVDGAIEAWFGLDEEGNVDALPSRSDFWRVAPDGLFYTRRGFDEDGRFKGIDPGTSFNVTTPTENGGAIIPH